MDNARFVHELSELTEQATTFFEARKIRTGDWRKSQVAARAEQLVKIMVDLANKAGRIERLRSSKGEEALRNEIKTLFVPAGAPGTIPYVIRILSEDLPDEKIEDIRIEAAEGLENIGVFREALGTTRRIELLYGELSGEKDSQNSGVPSGGNAIDIVTVFRTAVLILYKTMVAAKFLK